MEGLKMKKTCSKCKIEKDKSEFYKRKSAKDGLRSCCKNCESQQHKRYCEENKERMVEYDKKYRAANKERIAERKKKYREENKDREKEGGKKYRAANKERIAERKKKYREENKKHISERGKRYRRAHPLCVVLNGIRNRCYNPNTDNYEHYGAKGIKVCDEWKSDYGAFEQFALNNGWQPGYHTHRIDSDGDYEPGNVKFVAESEHLKLHGAETNHVETRT